MKQRWQGTLGITLSPPQNRRRRVLGIIAIIGVSLLLWGAAAAFFLPGYVDSKARGKLDRIASRAGVTVSVEKIEFSLTNLMSLSGVQVNDLASGQTLFSAKQIITDLTFRKLLSGQRRPADLHVDGMFLDVSEPELWQNVLERYFKKVPSRSAAVDRIRPTLTWANGRIRLPSRSMLPEMVEAMGRLSPQASGASAWSVTYRASIGGQQVNASVDVDVAARGFELGATFEPSLTLGLGDKSVRLGSIYVRDMQEVRIRDVRVKEGGNQVSIDAVSLVAEESMTLIGGALNVAMANVVATVDDMEVNAAHIGLQCKAGEVDRLLNRLQQMKLSGVQATVPSALFSMAAGRVDVVLDGVDLANPVRSIKSLSLNQADLSVVLPPPEQAQAIPYYREIETLLGRANDSVHGGGGPASPAPPSDKTLALPFVHGVPSLELSDGTLSLLTRDQTEPAVVFRSLNVLVSPEPPTDGVKITLGGRLKEVSTGEGGQFFVEANVHTNGQWDSVAVKLSGRKLASELARISDKIRLTPESKLALDVLIKPAADTNGVTAAGSLSMNDVGFFAPRIHGSEVTAQQLDMTFSVAVDRAQDKLVLDVPKLLVNEKAEFSLSGAVERLDGRLPILNVKLQMPRQDCQALIESIPRAMRARLVGIELSGSSMGHIDFKVDLLKPRTFKWSIDVDMSRCKIVRSGAAEVEKLNRSFVHEVVEKGIPIGVFVGPGTSHFRSISRIPKYVQMAALFTEDHSFFRHQGFRPPLIRRAIIMDLERGRYVYGGSTISQQLVKNLFLSREKTLSRKLEEAIIVWMMERTVPKKRILELYLNCIEYGPSIYGLSNAAQRYFGKRVDDLTVLEGAFLMGLKPYPWNGFKQLKRGYVSSWWRQKRLPHIVDGMHKRGWINQEQWEQSRSYDPIFVTSPHRSPEPPPSLDDEPGDE